MIRIRNSRRLAPLFALVLWLIGVPLAAQDVEIRFLDVGQGDAVLVRSGGKAALIDAGPTDGIAARLRALGVDSLDLIIASHNHADHIGGADAVLAALPVRFYLDNGHPAATQIQRRVLDLVESRGVTYLRATPRTLTLGDATLRVIPAPGGAGGDAQNNRSVVIVVERAGFRALFSGDSETEQIHLLLEAGAVGDVDVLKAAHHGSQNGVTPAWLSRTRPEVVVISAGKGNTYGHPHRAALRRYATSGRRVLRTDRHGDVVITVAPTGCYRVTTARRAQNLPAVCPPAPVPNR